MESKENEHLDVVGSVFKNQLNLSFWAHACAFHMPHNAGPHYRPSRSCGYNNENQQNPETDKLITHSAGADTYGLRSTLWEKQNLAMGKRGQYYGCWQHRLQLKMTLGLLKRWSNMHHTKRVVALGPPCSFIPTKAPQTATAN